MPPVAGSRRCFAHDPARGRDRAAARKRGGRNRRAPAPSADGRSGGADRGPVALRDVASVQALLEATVTDTIAQENSAQRSRTLGYLLGIALKALEVGELEERLAALEAHLSPAGPRRLA